MSTARRSACDKRAVGLCRKSKQMPVCCGLYLQLEAGAVPASTATGVADHRCRGSTLAPHAEIAQRLADKGARRCDLDELRRLRPGEHGPMTEFPHSCAASMVAAGGIRRRTGN